MQLLMNSNWCLHNLAFSHLATLWALVLLCLTKPAGAMCHQLSGSAHSLQNLLSDAYSLRVALFLGLTKPAGATCHQPLHAG